MNSREIAVWLDERWYDALSGQLNKQDTTVEDELNKYLDAMIGQLPERVRERVSREIWEEDQQRRQAEEAARRFSALRVTQDGRTDHLLAEGGAAMDTLHAALRLRAYLIEKGDGSQRFAEALPAVDHILPEVFPDYADELRQGVGRVTTALDIDLDRGTFSTLAGADGWQMYRISDVCLAAWQATLPNQAEWEERRSVFAEHLQDKLVEQEAHSMVPPSGPAM